MKLLRGFVATVVGGISLLTAAQQAGTVGPWWLELSRYLPFYLVVVPILLALAVSMWLGRWWRLACVATLGLFATVTMGLVWNFGPDANEGRAGGADNARVRLMTYNIKSRSARERAGGFAELAAEIALHRPDILVMQDAHELVPERAPNDPPSAPVFGLANVYATDQYVIASRYALRGCGVGRIGEAADVFFYLHCVVDVHGVGVNVVTAHFTSPRSGLNAARREGLEGIDEWRENFTERFSQSVGLAHDLAGAARPLIVAGDLNAPESSAVVRNLLALGLRDAFSAAGRGYGYSHGHSLNRSPASFLRIDHILASPDIGVIAAFVGGRTASDHRPVIADLRLPR